MDYNKLVNDYNKLSDKKNLEGEEALEAVKRCGDALRYVHNQTEAICLEAVKQDGFALQYVHRQTEAICLEAVKQHGYSLKYVNPDIIEAWKRKANTCNNKIITIDGKKFKLIEL